MKLNDTLEYARQYATGKCCFHTSDYGDIVVTDSVNGYWFPVLPTRDDTYGRYPEGMTRFDLY